MRAIFFGGLVSLILAAWACLPEQSSYGTLCGDNTECLNGTVCQEGICLPPGDNIRIDAGTTDAG